MGVLSLGSCTAVGFMLQLFQFNSFLVNAMLMGSEIVCFSSCIGFKIQCVSKRMTQIQIIVSNNESVLQLQNKLQTINPLNAELNPICYLLALLGAHHFLHVSRIGVKSLTLRLLMSYIYIYMEHLFLMFLDHTRHTTVGRTPLDEWWARRRDLYLTTHDTHNRQTSMPPVGFEPTISAGERPQKYTLDLAVTGTGTPD